MAMIREYLQAIGESKTSDPYFEVRIGEYHTSSLCPTHCLRAKWHSFTNSLNHGGGRRFPHKAQMRMRIGELVHRDIQAHLTQEDWEVEVEKRARYWDFHIVARCDILTPDKVIDIKTWERKSGFPKSLPNGYFYQVNTYCGLFSREKGEVWLINFDGEAVRFTVRYDHQKFIQTVLYAHLLHFHLINEIEPPPKEGCRCRHCKGE